MALAAIAKAQLNEKIEKNLDEFTKPFIQLIDDEHGLVCPTDDDFLMRFLRARDFKVERAFELLTNYYKARQDTEFFQNCTPNGIKHIVDGKCLRLLKSRDPEGRRIIYFSCKHWNAETMSADEIIKSLFVLGEEVTSEPETQENGVIFICNLDGIALSHLSMVGVKHIKMFAGLLRNSFPMKLRGLHYLNFPVIFEAVFVLLKTFLSDKIKERIKVHASLDGLHEHIPPECLPKSLSGELPEEYAMDAKFFSELFKKNDIYKENQKYGYVDDVSEL